MTAVDVQAAMRAIRLRGSTLTEDVADRVRSAGLSWSTSEVTQLSLELEDVGLQLWERGQFENGALLTYTDPGPAAKELRLRISSVAVGPGQAGLGGITVQARSEGAWKLKRRTGALVMPGASPSSFVAAEATAVGLRAVVQPTPTRTQVARDVPDGQSTAKGANAPSSWTTIQRLAQEVGFVVFEFSGTLYFAQPTWLMQRQESLLRVVFNRPVPASWGGHESLLLGEAPTCTTSEDSEVAVEIAGVKVARDRYPQARPGGVLELFMTPRFNNRYLISSMSMSLLGADTMVEVSATTPVNPVAQPPEQPASAAAAAPAAAAPAPAGSKSALDFVNIALSQQGKRYRHGAEASPTDASPDAFDCSELIEWCLRRVGVTGFPDGSAAQIARCQAIPVDQALRTRGALVYKPGHIGISLGDSTRTFEARKSSVPVGVFPAKDIRWTRGGLIPGLRYA